MIGRLVKPLEGERWYSLDPLPHFCNDFRWEELNESDCSKDREATEFLVTHERIYSWGRENVPLLCHLVIPFIYDPEKENEDEQSREYSRFCIEELGFQFMEFDEDGWCDLSMGCEVGQADRIIERIREKMKELNFEADAVEHFFENRIFRFEQVRCPRCHNICKINETYCSDCGLLVGRELVDWSTVEYEKTSKKEE